MLTQKVFDVIVRTLMQLIRVCELYRVAERDDCNFFVVNNNNNNNNTVAPPVLTDCTMVYCHRLLRQKATKYHITQNYVFVKKETNPNKNNILN